MEEFLKHDVNLGLLPVSVLCCDFYVSCVAEYICSSSETAQAKFCCTNISHYGETDRVVTTMCHNKKMLQNFQFSD